MRYAQSLKWAAEVHMWNSSEIYAIKGFEKLKL